MSSCATVADVAVRALMALKDDYGFQIGNRDGGVAPHVEVGAYSLGWAAGAGLAGSDAQWLVLGAVATAMAVTAAKAMAMATIITIAICAKPEQ